LASNSLLEGLVFAARIADDLKTNLPKQGEPVENNSKSILLDPAIRKDIANAMSKGAGVIRTRESLEEVLATLDQLAKKTSDQPCVEAWEVTNLHCLANVLVRSALIREETRGSHWREDFPNTLNSWEQRILQEMDTEGNYLHNLEKVINE
jgi:L-aspartate oxidase